MILRERFAHHLMHSKPCGACLGCHRENYCVEKWAPMVPKALILDQAWLRDLRNHAASKALHGSLWIGELFDLNERRPVPVFELTKSGKKGVAAKLDLESHLLPSDELIDTGGYVQFTNSLQRCLNRFLNTEVADGSTVFVTPDRIELARIAATLICIQDLDAALLFGLRPRP